MHNILYQYIDYKKEHVNSSKSTYTRHLVSLTKFFEYLKSVGIYQVEQIELHHITQFAKQLLHSKAYKTSRYYYKQATMHPRTVNSYISVIRCFLEYCRTIKKEVIPICGIKNRITHYPKPQTLSVSQVKCLLEQPLLEQRNDMKCRNHILLMLGLYCGLRINEVIQLKTKDVLTGSVLITSKFGHYRTVKIYPPIQAIILLYLDVRKQPVKYIINRMGKQVIQTVYNKESDYLLVCHDARKNGQSMTSHTVASVLRKYGPIIGEPRLNFHRLRGTFITQSLENDIPLLFVQEMAGHVDVKATQHYFSGSEKSFRITQEVLYK